MDACSCVNPVTEDFGPCLNNPCFCSKLWYVGPKQCSILRFARETVKVVVPLEELHINEECGIDENDSLKVEELGFALSGVLHVQDAQDQSSGRDIGSDQNAICNSKSDGVPEQLKVVKSGLLSVDTQKGLSKCATFPCSGKAQPPPAPFDGSKGIPSTSLHNQSSLESDNLAYSRSTSLPATLKLVSALKGGREQQGIPPKAKLNVKWTPDVYDPPATSMSHAVKNHHHHHHHRSKAKKKDLGKHKYKGKSSRGSTGEKKQVTRRSSGRITDPPNARLLQPSGSRFLLDGFSHSDGEAPEYAVGGQESKCGGSFFLVEPLATVHLPIAEAS